ncbi:MAG TPA: M14 family zinc carboxypeptidase [Vicinamibacterales bacterium]
MKRSLALLAVLPLLIQRPGLAQRPDPPTTQAALSDFFRPGTVFQDRNSDDVVDFVSARIVLQDKPSPGELAASADVAARLGFETSAMNLPLARQEPAAASNPSAQRSENGGVVFVGAKALPKGTSLESLGATALKAGDGVVSAFRTPDGPAIALLGADDAGLAAAALAFAGHLPHVGDQKSATTDAIADDVRTFLASKNIPGTTTAPVLYVKAGSDSIDRLVVDVALSGGDFIKAQVALNQFKATAAHDAKRALSYGPVRELRIRLKGGGAGTSTIDLARSTTPDPPAQGPGRRPGAGAKDNFDLSSFYSNDGALGDSDSNLIPDRVDALLTADGEGTEPIADLAARLALESTGVALPIAKPPKSITSPESEPQLVVIGASHPLVERLVKEGKLQLPTLQPGEGSIEVVKKAFGEKSALIVTGGDAAGVRRAMLELAEKLPYIWSRGKDRTTLDDVEDDVRKFVAGRSPAGQAAMGVYKLDQIAAQLAGKDLASARVRLFAEKTPDGLAAFLKEHAAAHIKADNLTVDVQNMDVQKGRAIIDDDFDVPSEVDDFWQKLRTRVIPAVKKRAAVAVEARLSEPPDVRQRIEEQARAELVKAGADERSLSVTVLSAYKQGYSWLYDVVRPAVSGKDIDSITIRFAEIGPPSDWKQQGMFVPTRWLLEMYPIDEILAKELGVDLGRIKFEMAPIGSPAYEVTVTGRAGGDIFHKTFDPKFVERPFFDRFPDYEHVRVTTGWIKADAAGKTVVDERIETDPERFWDHFQAKTLPALYDHVMALGRGRPRAEDAPFFGEMTVDLSLSEPDYRIPVEQEFISSMEAIHEELYFNTLHFFDVMGRFTRSGGLAYPGRIIPLMHPKADGKAGHAKITVTGFDSSRPAVVAEYVERSGRRGEIRLDIPKIAVDRPQALRARVRDGADGIQQLDLRLKVDMEKDERNALVARADEFRVDRSVISAEQVRAVLENLNALRGASLYRDALAYHDLGTLRVELALAHESKPGADAMVALQTNGAPAPWPDIRKYRAGASAANDGSTERRGESIEPKGESIERKGESIEPKELVQWDTPIPPPEAYAILARMSQFKEATVYKVGESYLGKDVWAMDLMPPVEATHWSQAKQTTMKPTVVYSARQHANEVSSTSHVLKLAELLLTDPAYRDKLNKVNVVIHPITNADGAQLAYDLQKTNPNYMLHAGYLGALGVDVPAAQWESDPIYPESGIRPKIWRTWLPDIFLNPHGYPTHEWVQLFSEYAAWVRTRAVETRDYWSMRGWWMPGFAWLDDPKYPRHKDEQMKLLEMITEYAKAVPETVTLNDRAYARYKRYSFDFDQKDFKLDFTNGVLIYKAIKGARANPQANDFMARNPNVTIWEGVTEAPDETARGDWLKMVANAGLQWDKAILDYLVQGHHEVERKIDSFWQGVSLSMNRPRPPKPEKKDADKSTLEEGR